MAKEEYKSERTKRIEKSKVDEDMPMVKKAVRGTALGISRAADKVEGFFKKKDEEKPEKKKMAVGGMPKKAAKKKAPAKKAAEGMLVIPVKMEKKSAPKKRK